VKYLLDTNVVSEIRRKSPDRNVASWIEAASPGSLAISVLTLGEIAKGAQNLSRRDPTAGKSLFAWLETIRSDFADRVLKIDSDVSMEWGRLCAHRQLPVIDGLLAATALVRGLTLVTRNIAGFTGTGVLLHNPWQDMKFP
jgi:hypothetical protein